MPIEPSDKPTRHAGTWRIFPAAAIIAIGVLFLLNNLGVSLGLFTHGNWWAVIILVGAIGPLSRAYELYRARGRFDAEVGHSVLAGAAVALVATMFLLGLDWSVWWPLFVILGGLFSLVRRPYGFRCRDGDRDSRHGGNQTAVRR